MGVGVIVGVDVIVGVGVIVGVRVMVDVGVDVATDETELADWIAASTSRYPYPNVLLGTGFPIGWAVCLRIVPTCDAESVGWTDITSPAAAATCGAA